MIQDSSLETKEQPLASAEQSGGKSSAVQATKPRAPRASIRPQKVTVLVLAGILLLAGIFFGLMLLPSPKPTPIAGVPVGTIAPTFVLPIYGGGGHGSIDLHALRGHPAVINFWSESCIPCRTEMPLLDW